MKKRDERSDEFLNYSELKDSGSSEKFKTTNINILLNRVRAEKRKSFNKKLIIFSLIISLIAIAMFFLN